MKTADLSQFREELLFSGVVLLLVVVVSFFALSRLLAGSLIPTPPTEEAVAILAQLTQSALPGVVLGEQASETDLAKPSPEQPEPTVNPDETAVNYGKGGMYDYDGYRLDLSYPRLSINLAEPTARKFMVDATLTNKAVSSGLPTLLAVSIMKDGDIIVPKAALSVNNSQVLKPGEQAAFNASISLIEGTDVKEILFTPLGDLPQIIHPLKVD
ncbi:hypothetical protein A2W24_02240 [Microgenomates group bacterium RBG_16_45_19]|nr:MAG: hypothetical protein A2W24_02240 [Microgenomates group bacterium RBG_16_45_19]